MVSKGPRTQLGFVRRSSLTTYELTEIGDAWLSEQTAINFACCFHAAFSWVFELLPLVGHSAFNVKSIQPLLFERFNVNISHDALRKRLNVLLKAGLLKKRSLMSYQATEHCDSFLSGYGFNFTVDSIGKQEAGPEQPVATDVDKLIGELWGASRDSGHPDRLERAVERCFSRLGFRTTLLGGSGDTDVLAVANAASRFSYSVVIDAKSTSNGGVSASQVDFDTLELHRRKHDASFVAVVGSNFLKNGSAIGPRNMTSLYLELASWKSFLSFKRRFLSSLKTTKFSSSIRGLSILVYWNPL